MGEISAEFIEQAKYINNIQLHSMKKKSSKISFDAPSRKEFLK